MSGKNCAAQNAFSLCIFQCFKLKIVLTLSVLQYSKNFYEILSKTLANRSFNVVLRNTRYSTRSEWLKSLFFANSGVQDRRVIHGVIETQDVRDVYGI